MKALIMNTRREGYDIDQIDRTMTVGELIEFLSQFDEDTKIFTGHDNQYTYGGIREYDFEERNGMDMEQFREEAGRIRVERDFTIWCDLAEIKAPEPYKSSIADANPEDLEFILEALTNTANEDDDIWERLYEAYQNYE